MLSSLIKLSSENKAVIFGTFLSSVLVLTSGCAKNGTTPVATLVNNVALKTYTQGTDEWIESTILLTTGGFQLAGINLPIVNPMDPTKTYGVLTLAPTLCSLTPCSYGGQLTIAINLTQSTSTQSASVDLPNGTALPVGGLQNATVVALPIAQTGAVIYLAFGQGVAMLGAAVPFSALDPAGKYVPGIDVFEPLTFAKVNLIAGIFAGSATNTTGVGIFLDLSSVMNQAPTPAPSHAIAMAELAVEPLLDVTSATMLHPWAKDVQNQISFSAIKPSVAKENKLYQKLYKLSQKGLTLRVN